MEEESKLSSISKSKVSPKSDGIVYMYIIFNIYIHTYIYVYTNIIVDHSSIAHHCDPTLFHCQPFPGEFLACPLMLHLKPFWRIDHEACQSHKLFARGFNCHIHMSNYDVHGLCPSQPCRSKGNAWRTSYVRPRTRPETQRADQKLQRSICGKNNCSAIRPNLRPSAS